MSNNSNFICDFSADDFTSNHQLEFYKYWLSIKGRREMPSRADIHPADIVKILPHLMLIEKKPDDFVVRLMGTRCAQVLGEGTGKSLCSSQAIEDVIAQLTWCAKNKKSYFHTKPLEKLTKKYVKSSALVMPLSNNDDDVNMFVLVHHFFQNNKYAVHSSPNNKVHRSAMPKTTHQEYYK